MKDREKKKLLKIVNSFCRRNFYMKRVEDVEIFPNVYWSERQKETNQIHKIFDMLGYDEESRKDYWDNLRLERMQKDSLLFRHVVGPIRRERRDNKDRPVGSGGDNRNKIRYPKKVRKTAWKRFYKIFPSLAPNAPKEVEEPYTPPEEPTTYMSLLEEMYTEGYLKEKKYNRLKGMTLGGMKEVFEAIFPQVYIKYKRWIKQKRVEKIKTAKPNEKVNKRKYNSRNGISRIRQIDCDQESDS